jgi:hypothetical protein
VGFDDPPHDRQPQAVAGTGRRTSPRRVPANEGLEGSLDEAGGEPAASVTNGHPRPDAVALDADLERLLGRVTVGPRVHQQIVNSPPEKSRVEYDDGRGDLRGDGHLDLRRGGLRGDSLAKPHDEDVGFPAKIGEAGSGHVEQIAQDRTDDTELRFDAVERGRRRELGLARRETVTSRFERDARARQRRAKLVADGTEKLTLAADHGFDAIRHAVEADRHFADLARHPPLTHRWPPPRPTSVRNARSPAPT